MLVQTELSGKLSEAAKTKINAERAAESVSELVEMLGNVIDDLSNRLESQRNSHKRTLKVAHTALLESVRQKTARLSECVIKCGIIR